MTRPVAIVTGAGGGIGRAIAARLATRGIDLSLADANFGSTAPWGGPSDESTVIADVQARGVEVLTTEGDLADRAVADEVTRRTVERFGHIDILVNCAGGAITPAATSRASESGEQDREALFRANYQTMVACSQSVAPHMIEKRSGVIVNITSGVGVNVVPRTGILAHYLASKAAVTSYTVSLANELGAAGIRVNAVSPGLILSPRVAAQTVDRGDGTDEQLDLIALRRFGEPDDIAKVVEFFATDLSSYVTGQVLAVNGG